MIERARLDAVRGRARAKREHLSFEAAGEWPHGRHRVPFLSQVPKNPADTMAS
jgi:hypothetical protein